MPLSGFVAPSSLVLGLRRCCGANLPTWSTRPQRWRAPTLAGYTQADLADKLGVSRMTVARGTQVPTLDIRTPASRPAPIRMLPTLSAPPVQSQWKPTHGAPSASLGHSSGPVLSQSGGRSSKSSVSSSPTSSEYIGSSGKPGSILIRNHLPQCHARNPRKRCGSTSHWTGTANKASKSMSGPPIPLRAPTRTSD